MMQSNLEKTQQKDLAGKTKLTSVRIYHNGRTRQFFIPLMHNARGEAILPQHLLGRFLDQMGVRRGDTYSVS